MPQATPLLGCIADDFTGATDLANMLVRGGMRTVQTIGIPEQMPALAADALVIALKSRTIPVAEAIAQSLAALRWLQQQGCTQFFFKYCSTFDSTDAGNIGQVTDALLKESGMEHHPLTPMADANLVRVLQRQTPSRVGLVRYDTVAKNAAAVVEHFTALRAEGVTMAIADAVSDRDLHVLGEACAGLKLITGGSGIALGLPENFRRAGLLRGASEAAQLPKVDGLSAVLAGSASKATNAQVAEWKSKHPAYRIDPLALVRGETVAAQALAFADAYIEQEPVLIYATATPDEVRAVQKKLGVAKASHLVEQALGEIARGLHERGVRRFVIAGGETSGAVVQALGVRTLRIGPQIDPGVPATVALDGQPLALTLKSGNFG